MAAAAASDTRARAALLSTLPPLLRGAAPRALEVDAGAATAALLEKLCLALRSADAAHPALAEIVALVKSRLAAARQAKAAAGGGQAAA